MTWYVCRHPRWGSPPYRSPGDLQPMAGPLPTVCLRLATGRGGCHRGGGSTPPKRMDVGGVSGPPGKATEEKRPKVESNALEGSRPKGDNCGLGYA